MIIVKKVRFTKTEVEFILKALAGRSREIPRPVLSEIYNKFNDFYLGV